MEYNKKIILLVIMALLSLFFMEVMSELILNHSCSSIHCRLRTKGCLKCEVYKQVNQFKSKLVIVILLNLLIIIGFIKIYLDSKNLINILKYNIPVLLKVRLDQ